MFYFVTIVAMPISRAEKETLVENLANLFGNSKSTIVVDFSSLNVSEVTDLRRSLKATGCSITVARNKLIALGYKRALNGANGASPDKLVFLEALRGSSMLVFALEDPVKAIKELYGLKQKLKDKFVVKAGIFEGKVYSGSEVEMLKNLPSKEECLGSLLFIIQSAIGRLTAMLNEPARSLVTLLDNFSKEKQ
ncbi:MAG: 50S ribosomal protein L10 [Deltaproteobacteria bacterium]|nr:50S ribosomal protein L10 [Deltaproteobacteria bacterium]